MRARGRCASCARVCVWHLCVCVGVPVWWWGGVDAGLVCSTSVTASHRRKNAKNPKREVTAAQWTAGEPAVRAHAWVGVGVGRAQLALAREAFAVCVCDLHLHLHFEVLVCGRAVQGRPAREVPRAAGRGDGPTARPPSANGTLVVCACA